MPFYMWQKWRVSGSWIHFQFFITLKMKSDNFCWEIKVTQWWEQLFSSNNEIKHTNKTCIYYESSWFTYNCFIMHKFNFQKHVSHLLWLIYSIILAWGFPCCSIRFLVSMLDSTCAQEHKTIMPGAKVRNT